VNIETLLLKLEKRLTERRKFNNPTGNFIRYLQRVQKNERFLSTPPIIDSQFIKSADLALLGPGCQSELGIELGTPLPMDYLKFCSRFEEYLIVGFAHLEIWNAEEAKDSILSARDVVDIPLTAPHRLFHFASNYDLTGYFSFRWSVDYKKMDVVYVWDYGDVSVNDLLGPSGDRFICDNSFTSWLSRMIETDGYPIFPGKRWPMADGGWIDDNFPYFKLLDT
jgi:hypothetical protein